MDALAQLRRAPLGIEGFRFGIALGVRLFSGSDLTLRTGIVRSEHFENVDLMPFYAQLGFNQAF
jgi:hypothetical protein